MAPMTFGAGAVNNGDMTRYLWLTTKGGAGHAQRLGQNSNQEETICGETELEAGRLSLRPHLKDTDRISI